MKSHYTFSVPESRRQPIASLTKGDEMGFPGINMCWINRINVPEDIRGSGYGNRLLRLVTDAADAEGVTLALEISSSGPLSNERLEQWYADHGFQFVELKIPRLRPRQVYPCWVRVPV